MIDFLDMDSNKLVISEFYENEIVGKYNYEAIYQRDKVWSEEKKSFLIDSILKNYPIPPIFLRLNIDPSTGGTKYDVIDGKQRLTTIKDFIEGKITLPDDFGGDAFGLAELNGATFHDLDSYEKYKKQFWRYRIPVIFIETDDDEIVKNVFDRLNRNGEPLVPQELRHSQYGNTKLYNVVNELATNHLWRDIFDRVLETSRMEDKEYVSELLFVLLERKITDYTKETLDVLYMRWKDNISDEVIEEYKAVEKYIKEMKLDYSFLKISKVSHLYAIWVLGVISRKQNISPTDLGKNLTSFYRGYNEKEKETGMENYKISMSSKTKGSSSRNKRVQALVDYLNEKGIKIFFTLE